MQATLIKLRDRVRAGEIDASADLLEDPDCLAELEFTFSVFRFRYPWGTIIETTVTNLADADDRAAVFALMPPNQVWLSNLDTDTMGVGFNGVEREVTYRCLVDYDN